MLALLCLLCSGLFAVNASAENAATKVDLYCTVNVDGDCQVSMTVNLHLEASDKSLTFPLPGKATDIKLNGGSVSTSGGRGVTQAALSGATGGLTGDFPVRFDYYLPKVVKVNSEGKLQLDLPMLCGFQYPIQNLSFVISLPGNFETMPAFTSIYQQTGFASNLDLVIKDNMLTGTSRNVLNDHEAVDMSMVVPKEMFPTVSTYQRTGNPELVPMGICTALALLYWLLFLRTLPPILTRSTVPPAGVGAGELATRLTLSGGDLTMMVLSWGQMGYLLIHLDGNGRILLHKRMEMGNERDLYEVRMFQSLFGNRRVVDCTGLHYAKQCRKASRMVPGATSMCRPRSGNRKVVQFLMCVAMAFCGVCIAMNMTGILFLQILFSVLFGIMGIFIAWRLQEAAYCLFSRHRTGFWLALVGAVIWIALGIISHQPWIPLGAVVVQVIMGFFVAYGGMRTDLNRTESGEILALRSYLKNLPRAEADRLLRLDPEYFFRMAPYAIALGVDKKFAAAFGQRKLSQCPFLVTRIQGKRTAAEWMRLMVQTGAAMDARYRRMQMERWMVVQRR